jgi:hypothetical protein
MRGQESGFTLLEALIAAAVLAGISALLAPALVGALDAAGRSHALTDRIERGAALDGVVHELFAATHQPPTGDGALQFSGAPASARFLVRPEHGNMQRAELAITGSQLTLRLSALDLEPGRQGLRETEVVLAEGFEAGRLSYAGVDRDRWRRVEVERWSSDRLPRLVALHLRWPDGTETRIQAEVAGQGRFECRFDSGRGLCLGDSY